MGLFDILNPFGTKQDALLNAIIRNDRTSLNRLMKSGARIEDVVDQNGYDALRIAAMKGHSNLIPDIIAAYGNKESARVPPDKRTPFMLAAMNGHVNALQKLIECDDMIVRTRRNSQNGRTQNPSNGTLRNVRSEQTQIDVDRNGKLRILLKDEFERLLNDRDVNGDNALILAVRDNQLRIVQEIFKQCDERHLSGNEVKQVLNATTNDGYTALMIAARKGHVDIVKQLLTVRNIDVNAKNIDHGDTALILACMDGNVDIIKQLINAGADVNTKNKDVNGPFSDDKYGGTALMIAARYGHVDIVKQLLTVRNIDVNNAKNNDGNTALLIAVKHGHVNIVTLLIDAGADVNAKNIDGDTALLIAVKLLHKHRHVNIVTLLIDAGADVNAKNIDGDTALILAVLNGNVDIIKLLINAGVDVNAKADNGNTALIIAAKDGYTKMVELLINAGADVNAKNNNGNTALIWASINGNIDIVKQLIDAGADVKAKNKNGDTALSLAKNKDVKDLLLRVQAQELSNASHQGRANAVKQLINAGVDVNLKRTDGNTALLIAAREGHISIVTQLINAGADVNATHPNGDTALMIAARNGHVDIVKQLLTVRNIDVNAKNKDGNTALILASMNGNVDIVKQLIKAGADVHAKNKDGNTGLSLAKNKDVKDLLLRVQAQELTNASHQGRANSVKRLINAGVDVNATHQNGNTALLVAARDGHVDIVTLLIKASADVNAKDNDGNTALIFASVNGNVEIVKQLIDAGADVKAKNKDGNTGLSLAKNKDVKDLLLRVQAQELTNASHQGRANAVKQLINAGVNVNSKRTDGNTALLIAAREGHISIVTQLINAGADVNTKTTNGDTALILASWKNHVDIVKQLLTVQNIDVDAKNKDGNTALVLAARDGYTKIVTQLINAGADVNATHQHRYTTLMVAAREGHVDIVKQLLTVRNIDVNAKDDNGNTALLTLAYLESHVDIVNAKSKDGNTARINAARARYTDIVGLLINAGADVNVKDKDGNTALILASLKNHVDIVKQLLTVRNIDVNAQDKDGNTALVLAARNGYTKIVGRLINADANVNAKNKYGDTALVVAATGGKTNTVGRLLDAGADVNAKTPNGNTALTLASLKNHVDIVKQLLAVRNIDVNAKDKDGNTALLIAAREGHISIVTQLINAGADVNAKTTEGSTALTVASWKNHVDIIKQLLTVRNIDVNAKNKNSKTALMIAARDGHINIVTLLINAGANVNTESNNGDTALIIACWKNHVDIVKRLLTVQDIDVSTKNKDGNTALIIASSHNHVDIVKQLLTSRNIYVYVDATNNVGNTALIVAARNGHTKIVKLLLDHGADSAIRNNNGNSAASLAINNDVKELLHKAGLLALAEALARAKKLEEDKAEAQRQAARLVINANAYQNKHGRFRVNSDYKHYKLMKFGVELECLHTFLYNLDIDEYDRNKFFARGLNKRRNSLIREDAKYNFLNRKYYHFLALDGYHGLPIMDDTDPIPKQPSWSRSTWQIEHDGSVEQQNSSNAGFVNYTEIVSPILSVHKNDNVFACSDFGPTVLKCVNSLLMGQPENDEGRPVSVRYKVNDTCSMHIHVSCIDKDFNHFKDPVQLATICMYWSLFEDVFEGLVAPYRLERKSEYFKSIKGVSPRRYLQLYNNNKLTLRQIVHLENGGIGEDHRYRSLNLQNLVDGGIGTIEIRIHQGLYDPKPMVYWAFLMTLFLNRALYISEGPFEEVVDMIEELSDDFSRYTYQQKFECLFDDFIQSRNLGRYYSFLTNEFYPDQQIPIYSKADGITDGKVKWILDMIFNSTFWDTCAL